MESRTDGPVDWTLLTRYVAGACSESEEIVVEMWAASDPQNRDILRDLRQVWEAVDRKKDTLPVDVDAAWDKLSRRIREEEEEQTEDRPARAGEADRCPRRRAHSRTHRHALRVGGALAAVVAVALGLFVFDGLPGSGEEVEAKVFTTQRGQRAAIELTDGTQVHLNVDSRLELPTEGFSEARRTVRLEGEAYFDVARDTARPFRVRARGASVRVLGTAFNVRAYATEAPMQVAVAEGEVSLRAEEGGGTDSSLRLRSEQLGIADKDLLERHRDVDLSARLAWTDGKLIFENASFREVSRKLERWYDLRIEGRVPAEAIDKLNATFDDQSLSDVLGDIALALNLQYRKRGEVVTFYRSSQSRTDTSTVGEPERNRPEPTAQPTLARGGPSR